jgi:cell division septum initiation protein DivIVA
VSIIDQIAFDQIADERDKAQQENKLLKQRVKRMEEALESIREYWNRDNNQRAMVDACWHAINTASEALEAKEAKP